MLLYRHSSPSSSPRAAPRGRPGPAGRPARAGRPQNDRSIRRSTAVALASVSSAAASLVRRLDECVADDLAERLGPDRVADQPLTPCSQLIAQISGRC